MIKKFWREWMISFFQFLGIFFGYIKTNFYTWFGGFEFGKGLVVERIYRQRGKYAGVFTHAGMVVLGFVVLTVGPMVLSGSDEQMAKIRKNFGSNQGEMIVLAQESFGTGGPNVLGAMVDVSTVTVESDKPRSEVLEYTVENGDTLESIGKKFGVSMDTIRWSNSSITSVNSIKQGQVIKIPPVTGVVHTVKSGETVYSIAKKYDVDAQVIVDFPFNTFTNDETFSLAIGQSVVVPEGVIPKEQPWSPSSTIARVTTPNAGVVSATGNWIWPAQGKISQYYSAWHKAIDIANTSGGPILAADAGKVIVAGWPDNSGYGNRVIIDHGNGSHTLYGHLSKISVTVGQTVNRGNVIGMMGSTGRSTGTHLHFEIRTTGGLVNPLNYLK